MKYFTPILMFAICMMLAPLVQAQRTDGTQSKRDRIEQFKIAYITKELSLTSEEAEKFWPLYNDMSEDLRQSKRTRKRGTADLRRNYSTMSDKDVEKKTLEILNAEIEENEKRKAHLLKISDVVGPKKVVRLLIAEQQFKKELLKKVNQRPQPNGRPERSGRPEGGRRN